ncbi:hypothetical protein [Niabella hibiscisoli]|uniref:hypothetical protein n=1 Tax=Niabella hibiscisoli TaxID=1825928 RepID=UPI001F0EE638|nr:hypothetical protein [Niabella hibiscisoli]MCH5719320.1 hypothetical protein [Niabella hibiscisoli]
MNKAFLAGLLIFLHLAIYAQGVESKKLICSYHFNNSSELKDWEIEGEGRSFIRKGKLILEPLHFQLLKKLMEDGSISKKIM